MKKEKPRGEGGSDQDRIRLPLFLSLFFFKSFLVLEVSLDFCHF
jgi:hypothetical protein